MISRHSPRSADPGWDNLGSWTPPPVGWMPAGDAFGTDWNDQRGNPGATSESVATPLLTGRRNHNDFLHLPARESRREVRMARREPGRRAFKSRPVIHPYRSGILRQRPRHWRRA